MKSIPAKAVEVSRSLSKIDVGGCDITKPNPVDIRLDSVLERMRVDWHETARYMITLSKDGDWNDVTVVLTADLRNHPDRFDMSSRPSLP